jgi:hypothetical protein
MVEVAIASLEEAIAGDAETEPAQGDRATSGSPARSESDRAERLAGPKATAMERP